PYAGLMPTLWQATPEDRLFASDEARFRADYRHELLGREGVGWLDLPSTSGDGQVALEGLYVERTLGWEEPEPARVQGQDSTDAAARKSSRRGGSRPRPAELDAAARPVAVNLLKALRRHQRVLVEAPFWAGKSTLCQWLVHQIFQRGEPVDLPIFIPFRDLA